MLARRLRRRPPQVRGVGDDRLAVREAHLVAGSARHDLGRGDDRRRSSVHAEHQIADPERTHRPPAGDRRHRSSDGEGLALQPAREVVRQSDLLERRPQHELARMQDERVVALRLDLRRQLVLLLSRVDVGVAGVLEDAEEAVQADVDARGLQHRRVPGVEHQPPGLQLLAQVDVREQHGADPSRSCRRCWSGASSRAAATASARTSTPPPAPPAAPPARPTARGPGRGRRRAPAGPCPSRPG